MPNQNACSVLLTQEENDFIFSLLGPKCSSLATTIVERYVAGGRTGHDDWAYSDVGIICLVKDSIRKSYFFRIYCPNRKQLVWEHELYNFMDYFKLTSYLHAFEGEEYIVGFNFANEDEGGILHDIVKEKLESKRQRQKRSRSSNNLLANNNNNNNNITRTKPIGSEMTPLASLPVAPSPTKTSPSSGVRNIQSYGGSKNKHKIKLSKDMIGKPQDFRHISHVGWDPDLGFNLDKVNNKDLEEFFRKAGVSESQLKDPDTRGFIYQFIEERGGMEAVKADLAPPVPARSKQQPHAAVPPQPPPPPPIRTLPPRAPPPPSVHPTPPPPPPTVPPPPAPPSNIPPPPPPSFTPSTPAPPTDSRSALMEAIRSGTSLKPVSQGGGAKPAAPSTDGGRGELLEQIRHGVKLNSVPKNDEQTTKSRPVEGGLANALADALAKRAMVIQSDSSSSSSSDIDEWDDD